MALARRYGNNMPNPFLSTESFNPRIAADVAEALKHNQERGRTFDIASAGDIGVQSLAEIIKSDTIEAKSSGTASLASFELINNAETRRKFETSFSAAEELFSRIHHTIPTVEQCANAGIDIAALGANFDRMQSEGLEPEIVLSSPNIDPSSWRVLYKSLARDIEARSFSPLRSCALFLPETVTNHWDDITALPSDVPVIPTVEEKLIWSLRLVPTADKALSKGTDYEFDHAVHPTVSEYLSLQAIRLQTFQKLLDPSSYTWLHRQSFSNAKGALSSVPIGGGGGDGAVSIGWTCSTSNTSKYGILGARHPVWK